mmetsp:Transcript_46593/g.116054  ORF Transcript_46593/g.116054 Transcript_46593/m.116054 type:complete len:295 (-) Transcript_46593:2289-3173(-)
MVRWMDGWGVCALYLSILSGWGVCLSVCLSVSVYPVFWMPEAMALMATMRASLISADSSPLRMRLRVSISIMCIGVSHGFLTVMALWVILSLSRNSCSPVTFLTCSMHSSSSALSSSPSGFSSSGTNTLSYCAAMRLLALAMTILMRSKNDLTNGHSLYMVLSISPLPLSNTSRKAVPRPSHTGRWNRVWVHAKIHGIALSVSTPPCFLLAGREPMLSRPSSCSGVAARKYSTKRGCPYTTSRYLLMDTSEMCSMRSRHSSRITLRVDTKSAFNTAVRYASSVRSVMALRPKAC